MRLSALREIFRHFSPSELPEEFAACLAGDKQAISANHAAYRSWQVEDHRRRMATLSTPTVVTQDPGQGNLMHIPSQQQATDTSTPSPHASLHSLTPTARNSTVHPTEAARGKRSQPDLALQVCTRNLYHDCVQISPSWDPQILFPEISLSVVHQGTKHACLNNQKEQTGKGDNGTYTKGVTPQKPRRSARNKNSRIKEGDRGVIAIEVQDFIDVPLKYNEGTELLALIGASSVPIPPHLILPSHQQITNMEVGQSSRAQPKRKKQTSPTHECLQESPNQILPQAGSEEIPMGSPENPISLLPAQSLHLTGQLNQMGNPQQDHTTGIDASLQEKDESNGFDDPEDDPYFDRVDYSDEDLQL